jgi:hypothetical protein
MLKDKDSLQITRYVLDKMGEDRENLGGWLRMLGELMDEDVCEYGMSLTMLNGMRVWSNTHRVIISSV